RPLLFDLPFGGVYGKSHQVVHALLLTGVFTPCWEQMSGYILCRRYHFIYPILRKDVTMKKICRLQKMIILLCLVLLSCNPVARADFDSPVETYVLSGYEIFIGIDYRGTRYGTLFTGILKSQDNQNVGYWNVCIHHTWTENIEVCN